MVAAALLLSIGASAQDGKERKQRHQRDTTVYSDTYLDTVQVNKVFVLNDYTLFGVEVGATLSRQMFNPSYTQTWRMTPEFAEVTLTRYGKLFGYMPYFGYRIGLSYGHEGYKMKQNPESGYIGSINGATECVYDVVEMPFLAHFHFDVPFFKIMLDIGPYAGYRMNIERIGDYVADDIRTTFLDTDRRIDYGIRAGAGFAIVLDPVELHIGAKVRYSWSTLYDPDYSSQYYYRFAYPLDVMVTAGLHFQLTKKTGSTSGSLKKQAREIVFGQDNTMPETTTEQE